MKKNYRYIEIAFKDNTSAVWDAERDDWCDYSYDGKMFIIKDKAGSWIGFYNLDCIRSIVVTENASR